MSLIQISNLTFGYDGSVDNVFDGVSLQLDTDWKLGFVGRNGRGKTTLLRLMTGAYEYRGSIDAPVGFDYFPFPVPHPGQPALEAALEACPGSEEWRLRRELSLLGVPDEGLERPYSTLSGGEQVKLLLGALFCRENRFLLIDEPTNHLDLEGRRVVGDYLSRKKGFILVSHDRAFLDGCVDHILSINRAGIEVQRGNFSSWQRNRALQDAFELAENERLQREVGRLREAARRTAGWSDAVEKTKYGSRNSGLRPDRGFIGHKSAKMMKRAKVTEQRQLRAAEEKSRLLKNLETAEPLAIHPLEYPKERLAEASDLRIAYGERIVCGALSFRVERGDRLALCGPNGCGKSSLLRLLAGQELPHTGLLRLGSGLILSVVPQDCSFLRGSLRDFARLEGLDESLFKAILRKLDFSRLQFEKDMADYSAGQKKKVLIARSLCQQAHLYLWDEPLNFIDLLSRMQIERLLLEHRPTMVLVEHDRAFLDAVATKRLALG